MMKRNGRTTWQLGFGLLVLASMAAQGAEPCGTVEVLRKQLDKEQLYSVAMLGIDGKAPFRTPYRFTLAPGLHVLELGERIPQDELSFQVQRSRDRGIRKAKLELTVEPDKHYLVAAKFDKENSSDVKAYWKPVVVAVSDLPCTPE